MQYFLQKQRLIKLNACCVALCGVLVMQSSHADRLPFTLTQIAANHERVSSAAGHVYGNYLVKTNNNPLSTSEPVFGHLTVRTKPADAIVRIMNIQEKYTPGIQLKMGESYDIFVTKKGFRGERQVITLDEFNQVLGIELEARISALPTQSVTRKQINKSVSVRTTGLATYDTDGDNELTEARTRAINNAIEIALLRVAGVIVSGEKNDISRLSSSVNVSGDLVEERLRQDEVFHNTVVARTSGFARLLKIENEGEQDGVYTVNAEVEVSVEALENTMIDAGVFWERVGSPIVHIALRRTDNGHSSSDAHTLAFLRDSFTRNGISVSSSSQDAAYMITANLLVNTEHISEFDTYSSACTMSYEVFDSGTNSAVGASSHSGTAIPGFSIKESAQDCAKNVVPVAAKKLVAQLIKEFNQVWNDGRKYQLKLVGLQGDRVSESASLVRNIFRVSDVNSLKYSNTAASMVVQFKGQPFEFVEALTKTFEYAGITSTVLAIVENNVSVQILNWEY